MYDTSLPEEVIEGTVKEILDRIKAFPDERQGRFELLPENGAEPEEAESQRLLGILEGVLEEIDPAQIEPAETQSPYEAAVLEKYRRQGWSI
jgi:hypothetical protein